MEDFKFQNLKFCPLCGGENLIVYLKNVKSYSLNINKQFNLLKCKNCAHIFTNPIPKKKYISDFYPDSLRYYKVNIKKKQLTIKEALKESALKHFYNYPLPTGIPKIISAIPFFLYYRKKFLMAHIPKFKENGRLLDIGCSWGNYLLKMRDLNWNIMGIEMNKKAVEYGNSLGLRILFHDIENFNLEKNYFDVVNLSMVLEHVYDPVKLIKNIYTILKKQGTLIISVPNIEGIEAKIFKRYFYGLHIPQHLHHFSLSVLKNILEKEGFKIWKIVYHNNTNDFMYSIRNIESLKIFSNSIFKNFLVRPFINIMAFFKKTSKISIYAIK